METIDDPKEERRQYYRLAYPLEAAPGLMVAGHKYPVMDISERGIRFKSDFTRFFDTGEIVRATLLFPEGESMEVTGFVLRLRKDEVVILLIKWIPYQKIQAEQISLRQRFGFAAIK